MDDSRRTDRPAEGPTPPRPQVGAAPTGQKLLGVTFAMLRQDRQMLALPLAGSIFGLLAFVLLFLPGYAVGALVVDSGSWKPACYAGAALGGFGATIVAVYVQTALVIAANERADGGAPTARSCLREAWAFRWKILGWSLVTATVGFVLHVIHDRLGFLGSLLNFFGGLAWGVATFLVVPVLVAEEVGPVTAVRRSTQVLRATWGTSLRTALRGGVIAAGLWVLPAVALVTGLVLIFAGNAGLFVVGIVLTTVAVIALVVLSSVVGAAGTYARALIYRYAAGLPTPGIDDRMLAGAVVQR